MTVLKWKATMDNNSLNEVLCPFYVVTIDIKSDLTERLGVFPLFLLESLSVPENTLKKIACATNLSISTIIDTIESLINNKLIVRNNTKGYNLTELGNTYLKINRYISSFKNNSQRKYAVNGFTGRLEDVEFMVNEPNPSDAVMLPVKASRLLMKNPDYSNVREYMKNKVHIDNFSITDNDYKYLKFFIKPEKLFYVPYEIPEKSYDGDPGENNLISLQVPVEEIKLSWSHTDIETHTNIISYIAAIYNSNPDFLSDSGKTLAEIFKKICEFDKTGNIKYMDCYSGTKLCHEPNDIKRSNADYPVIALKKRRKTSTTPKNVDNNFIFIPRVQREVIMTRLISFDKLKQKG